MSDAEDDEFVFIHSKLTEVELQTALGPVKLTTTVKDDAECEKAAMIICSPVRWGSSFDDNLIAACSVCNEPVFYRPHSPKTPPKVCADCAASLTKKLGGRS